jgi:hypothetical protein
MICLSLSVLSAEDSPNAKLQKTNVLAVPKYQCAISTTGRRLFDFNVAANQLVEDSTGSSQQRSRAPDLPIQLSYLF